MNLEDYLHRTVATRIVGILTRLEQNQEGLYVSLTNLAAAGIRLHTLDLFKKSDKYFAPLSPHAFSSLLEIRKPSLYQFPFFDRIPCLPEYDVWAATSAADRAKLMKTWFSYMIDDIMRVGLFADVDDDDDDDDEEKEKVDPEVEKSPEWEQTG